MEAGTVLPADQLAEFARNGDVMNLQRHVTQENVNVQNERGHSLLMIACYNDQPEAARFLLSIGADPNLADEAGNTPLMGAAFKGDVEIAKLLVQAGADFTARNPQGLSAEGFAERFGADGVKRYLASLATESLHNL